MGCFYQSDMLVILNYFMLFNLFNDFIVTVHCNRFVRDLSEIYYIIMPIISMYKFYNAQILQEKVILNV